MDCLFCTTCGKPLTDKQMQWYIRNKSAHPYCSTTCWGKRPREHNYDDTFLDEDSDLAAYFTGWFVADGHFAKNDNSIKFVCVDKQLVKEFLERIRFYNKIHVRHVKGNDGRDRNPQYGFALSGNVRKRIEEMGYSPGSKTGKEFLPDRFNNKKWFFSFLRGFVDGDGTINIRTRGDISVSMVSASLDMILSIHEFLYVNKIVRGGDIYTRFPTRSNGAKICVYKLTFGHFDSIQICQRMYADATIKLERKYLRYMKGTRFALKYIPQTNTTCSYPGCNRDAIAKELCKKHYDKIYRIQYFKDHKQEIYDKDKLWKLMNREKYLARRRAWRIKNQEKENARSSQWKKDHIDQVREYKRQYRSSNRDKVNASKRSYRDRNIEKVREQEKASYQRNRENKLAWHRQYKEKNHEKILKQAEEYRNRPEVKARNTKYWKDYYLRKKAEREASLPE